MICLKKPDEIRGIEAACRIVADVLARIGEHVREGATTKDIDRLIDQWIRAQAAKPAFLGYRGYPASSCISINEEVVHGIPGPRQLNEGDLVGIDVGVEKNGFFGDAAMSFGVGRISEEKQRLMDATQRALAAGIAQTCAGNRIGDISHAIQSVVEREGFAPVRALVGHGVGKALHEEPQIPNYGEPGRGPRINDGMVLAIEPMVNAGTYEVYTEPDGWTVVSEDHRPSAHFEHTVAVVGGKPRILTTMN